VRAREIRSVDSCERGGGQLVLVGFLPPLGFAPPGDATHHRARLPDDVVELALAEGGVGFEVAGAEEAKLVSGAAAAVVVEHHAQAVRGNSTQSLGREGAAERVIGEQGCESVSRVRGPEPEPCGDEARLHQHLLIIDVAAQRGSADAQGSPHREEEPVAEVAGRLPVPVAAAGLADHGDSAVWLQCDTADVGARNDGDAAWKAKQGDGQRRSGRQLIERQGRGRRLYRALDRRAYLQPEAVPSAWP